jgi:phosphate transport system permease protein
MTVTLGAPPHPLHPLHGSVSRARKIRNGLATVLVWFAVALAVVPLALVVYHVIRKGAVVMGIDFLTKPIPITSRRPGPGMGPAIVGTLLITGAATAMAVPLGVLAAIYLNEYGKRNRLASVIRFLSDVMAGVPSIVMGLFIYTVWVLRFGQAGIAGALALACLMLPIVIRTTETILALVPSDLREASAALGATPSRTILGVVLPAALPGITSGALLAVARAAGETAPLLFTIGAARELNLNLFNGASTALPLQIFRNAQLPFVGAQDRAWGAALTLIGVVLVLMTTARIVSARFQVR